MNINDVNGQTPIRRVMITHINGGSKFSELHHEYLAVDDAGVAFKLGICSFTKTDGSPHYSILESGYLVVGDGAVYPTLRGAVSARRRMAPGELQAYK